MGVNPSQRLVDLIATLPDGALITTDTETAGVVRSAIDAARRRITVVAYPFVPVGDLCARWDGPCCADGEQHEVQTWL